MLVFRRGAVLALPRADDPRAERNVCAKTTVVNDRDERAHSTHVIFTRARALLRARAHASSLAPFAAAPRARWGYAGSSA